MDNEIERMQEKLEAPWRVAELDPAGTLEKIGFQPTDVLCDIGAGTGIFENAAAACGAAKIIAVDISAAMRQFLAARFAERIGRGEIEIRSSVGEVEDGAADIILICTVLHEVGDQAGMIREMNRILRSGGRAAVIEFRPEAEKGAPIEERIPLQHLELMMQAGGFVKSAEFLLGENLYAGIFSKDLSSQ